MKSSVAVMAKRDYAPQTMAGLCGNWMAKECVGQATKTGFCEVCTEAWVKFYVGRLGSVDALIRTSPEFFQRELSWPADDPLGAISLDQAREMRLAIGRALSPVTAIQSINVWKGLPVADENRVAAAVREPREGFAALDPLDRLGLAFLAWVLLLACAAAVAGVALAHAHSRRHTAVPHTAMEFYWDAQPAVQPLVAPADLLELREVRL